MNILESVVAFLLIGLVSLTSYIFYPHPEPFVLNVETLRAQTVFISDEHGHGSGVIYSATEVVTAKHVVKGHEKDFVNVTFFNGETAKATVEWENPDADIAVLFVKVPEKYVPAVTECKLPITDAAVIVVGSPLGVRWSVSHGAIVTDKPLTVDPIPPHAFDGMTRQEQDKIEAKYAAAQKTYSSLVPFSAITAPGGSGGPVFDSFGHLIGIVTAILIESFGGEDNPQASTFNVMTPSKFFCGQNFKA